MGLLIDGKWHTDWYDTTTTGGEFIRQDSQFRSLVTPQSNGGLYTAEKGRYHLFVSLACPWAHRTMIFRKLKKLESVIGVTLVEPKMLKNGWEINQKSPIPNIHYLYEVYTQAQPDYSGRVTVPVLWDKKIDTIVNNESADIIRMLNSAFNEFTPVTTDYYPKDKQTEIDTLNELIYNTVNNGVYKCGFATTQDAYDHNVNALFESLDLLEDRLNNQRFLIGPQITEADWRLFTTLIRFDSVYHGHFKTNLKRIEDYHNLSNYLRDLYQYSGVAGTVDFDQIKTHYYYSQDTINPTRIIPVGPEINYLSTHDRHKFS